MRTRIMSGAVLIVILFTCLYFGGWVTFGFSLFISLVGMYELIKVKKLEKTGLAVVGYIAAITYYFILSCSFMHTYDVSICIYISKI